MKSAMLRNLLRLCLPGVVLLVALDASAQAIIQIASDGHDSYFVKSDGSLWKGDVFHSMAKLQEDMRRMADEFRSQRPATMEEMEKMQKERERRFNNTHNLEPTDLVVSNGVTAAAMNGQHDVFFIKTDGSLWAMGSNLGGYLGDGTFDTPSQPVEIVPGGVVAVAGGESHTIFLKDDGSVWGFGWNADGRLGDGAGDVGEAVMRPKKIVNGDVTAIAAGYYHSLIIKKDGSLWGTGGNGVGQLGLGGKKQLTPEFVQIVASNVVSIAAANGHSLFIKSDGSLWAMGLNDWGQIGNCRDDWAYRPELIMTNHVIAVAAGASGSLLLKRDGSLWAMGINWGSDYGEGITFHSRCPVQIFATTNSALVAGYYYNAQLKAYTSIGAGKFSHSTEARSSEDKGGLRPSLATLPGYNLITVEPLPNGDARLTYYGNAGENYALERSSSLANPNWVTLFTNKAPVGGVLVMTNTPDTSMNNFWRIRAVK